jgi:hypothetical protein
MSLRANRLGFTPNRRRAGFHEAHGGLDRLLHDLAKLAGRLDLALAGHGDCLDGQQLAADLGPGEAGDRADLIFLFADPVTEAADSKEVLNIVVANRDALIFALENVAERLAGDFGELALERADARLASVIARMSAQAVFGELELAFLQPVRFHLLGDQVALGDLDLFVLGVALEADDLHPVQQRLRHVERVGGGDEHHVRQIVVELQIMVLERVLFRIEHLEQRR